MGYSLPEIAELENDAGLGNGGLGRLAACFIDSLTTLICLHTVVQSVTNTAYSDKRLLTVIRQNFLIHGLITVMREIARPEETVEVKFGGEVYTDWVDGKFTCRYNNSHTILAMPYDVPLCGYDSKIVNKLRLWSSKSPDHMNMQEFNSGNYVRAVEEKELAEVISKVLYPEDNHTEGKELRLKATIFPCFCNIAVDFERI